MSLPKILITTYHEAFVSRGGGEFEIFYIENLLKQEGFIVDIYGPYSQDIEKYDVVLHFSVEAGGLKLLKKLKSLDKKIILFPNVYFSEKNKPDINILKEFLDLSQTIVFKSLSEKNNFKHYANLDEKDTIVVKQITNNNILKNTPKNLFPKLYNLDKYAICMGIIEPVKNQLIAIEAMKKVGLPLVLVGKYRDKDYYDTCVEKSEGRNVFIESLPYHSEIMRSALRDSSVYIEISNEPAGLSAIDAGLSNCNLVLSDIEWSHEYFADTAIYAQTNSVKHIYESILQAMEIQNDRQQRLKTRMSLLHHDVSLLVKLIIGVKQ